jgi:hypothetical protein
MKNKAKITNVDYIALGILGISTIVVFYLEITSPNAITQRETALFNTLEFILAVAFGWVLQRIDARRQFQENLKGFALSAYRRIIDIEKSVSRISGEIERVRISYPADKSHELDMLRIIAEGTNDTVQSSIADWSDVIGDEVQTLKQIAEKESLLETTKASLLLQSRHGKQAENEQLHQMYDDINSISKEIQELRKSLPMSLKYGVKDEDTARTRRLLIQNHFFDSFYHHREIILHVQITSNKDKSSMEKLIQESQLSVVANVTTTGKSSLNVRANGYGSIGEIKNNLSHIGIQDSEFIDALLEILNERVESINGNSPGEFSAKLYQLHWSLDEPYLSIIVPANPDQLLPWG